MDRVSRKYDRALEHYVTEPAHLAGVAEHPGAGIDREHQWRRVRARWYGDHPEPGLYRKSGRPGPSENLRYLCRHIRSHLFFAHVRAATGTPITRPNCHPFASAGWIFMHNGFVGSWNRMRRQVENLITDEFYPSRVGTTDSEAVFLAIMGAGAKQDPVGATARILGELTRLMNQGGYREKLRFTAALANGHDLYAFRYAVNDKANSLYYRESEGGVVIVSEPLDRDHTRWQAVPENHVVVARAGKPAEVLPFLQEERTRAA